MTPTKPGLTQSRSETSNKGSANGQAENRSPIQHYIQSGRYVVMPGVPPLQNPANPQSPRIHHSRRVLLRKLPAAPKIKVTQSLLTKKEERKGSFSLTSLRLGHHIIDHNIIYNLCNNMCV